MAQFKPISTTSSKLNNKTKAEGQFIVTTDDGKIYLDTSSSNRVLVGSTYNNATTTANGLMSSDDKSKLNGVATGATKNTASTTTPKVAGTATVGTETNYARGDHVHPLQTTVSGNAGTATKLSSTRTFTLAGDAIGSATSDLASGITISDIQVKTMVGYGECTTVAATAEKVVTVADSNWKREVGSLVAIKFTNSNSASNVTLNVNNTGAAGIIYNNTTTAYTGTSTNYCGYAGRTTVYMWTGTYWMFITNNLVENDNTIPAAYCSTAAGTAAKTASMSGYSLLANSYTLITIVTANTAASALTLNINGKGAKPIYINGSASSSTNYTLPAGSYIIYYDGANYHFRTDGKLPGEALLATTATTATKLSNTSAVGSSTKPVYFTANGVPAAVADTGVAISITGSSASCTGNATTATTASKVSQALTFNNGGSGATSGTTYNGSTATTISYNTIGAAKSSHTHAISDVTNLQSSLDSKLNTSLKGVANGVASLDSTGKVPSAQLPSFVDDVIEGYLNSGKFYATRTGTSPNFSYSLEITGETGKIYVDLTTNKTYRWGGSSSGFVEISESLALGETASTAYYGDKGATLYTNYGTGVTKGSSTRPIYINNGVPTQCNDTLANSISGKAATAGTADKLGTSTVGSGTKPIYLNSGTATASSSTVGSGTTPVYLNSGTITSLETELRKYNGALASSGWKFLGGRASWAGVLASYHSDTPTWLSSAHSSTVVFGASDTKGYIDTSHDSPILTVGGGSVNNSTDDAPKWYMKFSGTSGATYTLPASSKTLTANDGSNASGSWGISITKNAATATKLSSTRTFALTSDVTGTVSSDLSSGVSIETTVKKMVGYGTCGTAAGTAEKAITIADSSWTRIVGSIVGVKFTNTNTASSVKLNVNSTGAASIWYNNAAYTGSSSTVCGYANRYHYYMWDGTYWVWLNYSVDANDNTYTSAYCSTAAGTATKVATMNGFVLRGPSYVHLTLTTANTAASALTLNINSTGAKSIYINGSASSSSNYTLPAGSYLVYYDGTNYHFRTDAKLQTAINADLTTNVAVTNTNPTSGTWYFNSFVTANGSQGAKINDGNKYYSLEGTTSSLGRAILQIGNATASGTAGNKYGQIRLYGQNAGYAQITAASTSEEVALTLPSSAGTLARTADNVASATKLETARTLTIGSTGKTFNGSANVSWTLAEIGAAATSHTHNYAGSSSAGGVATSAAKLSNTDAIGSATLPVYFSASGVPVAINTTGVGISITGSSGSCTGNAATATALATGRTLTIGNTGKTFNGGANVSWTLAEIGAAAASHTHSYAGSSSAGGSATSAVKLDSSAGSSTLPVYFSSGKPVAINTTGIGISITGNAATATKLATARTINGVSFDGTANITVADSTKLPLTGGTLTGSLTMSDHIVKNNVRLNAYKFDCSTGTTGIAEHFYLGQWSGNTDGDSLHIEMFTGNGWNAREEQNLKLDIMCKNAYQDTQSTTNAFALTYVETMLGTQNSQLGLTNSDPSFEVFCHASAHNTCNIYLTIKGGGYYAGYYKISYSGAGTWTNKGMEKVTSFSGTRNPYRHGSVPGVHCGTSSNPVGWSGTIYIQY